MSNLIFKHKIIRIFHSLNGSHLIGINKVKYTQFTNHHNIQLNIDRNYVIESTNPSMTKLNVNLYNI